MDYMICPDCGWHINTTSNLRKRPSDGCRYLYADWCHNPVFCERDGQELCPFYHGGADVCEGFEKSDQSVDREKNATLSDKEDSP